MRGFTRVLALLLIAFAAGCDLLQLEPTLTLATIEIQPADTVLLEGDTLRFTVTGRDGEGRALETPAWRTPQLLIDDHDVLRPVSGGRAIAESNGETTVRARLAGLTATADIGVNPLWNVTATHAYITQAAQNPSRPNPLIANRKGLLRIFVTLDGFHTYDPPEINVRLHDGDVVFADTLLSQRFPEIMTAPDEGRYDFSYNLHVPAEHMRRGLAATITYDPNDRQRGIQGEETVRFDVRVLRRYDQVIVPVIVHYAPNENTIQWANEQSHHSRDMRFSKYVLPFSERTVTARDPYTTRAPLHTREGWLQLIDEIRLLRFADNAGGKYYYGAVDAPGSILGGLGYVGGPVSIGLPRSDIFTHEVGHNMSLDHAPCGNPGGTDPDYPVRNGTLDFWGWNPDADVLIHPRGTTDFMGYCSGRWVSAYHFEKMRTHRDNRFHVTETQQPVLWLWGGTDELGQLSLNPALMLEGPSSTPDDGPYLAHGIGENGEMVFEHRFTPYAVSHSETERFGIAIPYDPSSMPTIALITVTGPGVMATVSEDSHPAVAVVMDAATDRVISIWRDWSGQTPRGTRVIYSSGLPPREVIR